MENRLGPSSLEPNVRMSIELLVRALIETAVAWVCFLTHKLLQYGPSEWAAVVTILYTLIQIARIVSGWVKTKPKAVA
jgi:hypothetical protein